MNNILLKHKPTYITNKECKSAKKLKRFRSAYILFSLDYRKELQQKFKSYSNPELTRIIAAEWKTLDISKKEVYYSKEKDEKEIFERTKKEEQIEYKYSKNKKLKKPLRFRTPYMFYIMDHKLFLNNKDKYKNIELIKKLSNKWKLMGNEEKTPYIERSISDKVRYQEDWEAYIVSFFKIKKKNIKRKEKTEKMIYDLMKICNNNEKFYVQLKNVWNKINTAGGLNDLNEAYNADGKLRNKILLKKLIFKIEKVPRSIKEEIKYEKSNGDENVFSKYIKEEVDDSNDDLYKIDDMIDSVEHSNNLNGKSNEDFKHFSSDYLIRGNEFSLGRKRNRIHLKK